MKNLLFAILTLVAFSAPKTMAESNTAKGVKEDYKNFKDELSEKLKKMDADLKTFSEKTKDKTSEVHNKTVSDLKKARAKVQEELDELKDDSKGTWKKAKKGISKSIDDLNEKIQDALK
jgi:hypothetical protein